MAVLSNELKFDRVTLGTMKRISFVIISVMSAFVFPTVGGSDAIRFPDQIQRSSFGRNTENSSGRNENFRNDSVSSRHTTNVAAVNERPAVSTDTGTAPRKPEKTDETTTVGTQTNDEPTVDSRFLVNHVRRQKTADKNCRNGQTRTFSGECKRAFVDPKD